MRLDPIVFRILFDQFCISLFQILVFLDELFDLEKIILGIGGRFIYNHDHGGKPKFISVLEGLYFSKLLCYSIAQVTIPFFKPSYLFLVVIVISTTSSSLR